MIEIYASNNKTQLSPHFNVKEFKCKCGANHEIKISEELIDKLEKLYSKLKCSKIIITSGYRCPTHDKNVGGSGNGQHTKGTASDVNCYDKNGKLIPSSKICCVAQDVGFNGIANINTNKIAVHLDVSSRKWYGDETITTTKSITNDFYDYYNLSKSDVYGSNYEEIGQAFEKALKDIKNLDSVKKLLDLV